MHNGMTHYYYSGESSSIHNKPSGCPKVLADIIRAGRYDPLSPMPADELKAICTEVGLHLPTNTTRVSIENSWFVRWL